MEKTIFVVDDSKVNLMAADNALSEFYRVFPLSSAKSMFELFERVTPDLILLDIEMPEMDGFEALKLLKMIDKSADIPVIFLTARIDAPTEVRGFELGAVDFISKPFSELVLLNRIKTQLDIDGLIRERTEMLRERTEMLRERTESLEKLQTGMVSVISNLVESRDKLTGRHIERTSRYLRILFDAMVERGVYVNEVREWDMEGVISSARLHDVGKIIVSDLLLNKKEKLTNEEFETMKTHTIEGENIIEGIVTESGGGTFLHNAKMFAGYHHEHWDGTGYPRGLKGEEIPLQGRIMAIADVYDALVSERPYKPAFTHETAIDIITENKGKHFDPLLVDIFLEVNDMFAEVSKIL